ncbi:hypothetical protein JKF63_06312 [Porcisia hertigi]|uniref:Uncharacterized protein n=1 Tax=Porcisia hertigi TaxID=2761500 RepID=A0A836I1E7_9TRYP|nr:hypothetical protein JKF63_06312 [Porcisia hertigi]
MIVTHHGPHPTLCRGTAACTVSSLTSDKDRSQLAVTTLLLGERMCGVLHRGRYTAAQAGLAASKWSGPTGSEVGSGDHGDGRRRYAVRYARSDTHITLFAPFRSLDVTLYNPRVDICESARFDVLVRKECPKAAAAASSLSSLEAATLEGQQEVWDEGRCMFVRVACVNDELRVRSLQFVSHKLARALEEHAVFGRGEPLFLELLRRLPMAASVHKSSPQRRAGTSCARSALPHR